MRNAQTSILLVLCFLLIGDAKTDAQLHPPTSAATSKVIGEYTIDHWGEPIMIPVVGNGEPAYFVLDTGATISVVDSKCFPHLKMVSVRETVDTTGGDTTIELCDPPVIVVGPFAFDKFGPVARCDLSDFRQASGRPVIGILGMSVLKAFVVQIDYDNRKVRFLLNDAQQHSFVETNVAIQPDEIGWPTFKLKIGGIETTSVIDTGNTGFADLPSEAFDHLSATSKSLVALCPSLTMAGTFTLRYTRCQIIQFGGIEFPPAIVGEAKSKSTKGFVGLQFLERGLTTIDFQKNRLYFKPGNEFNHPSESDMAGVHFGKVDANLIVHSVNPNSPAEKAGFQNGDVLLQLQGKAAKDWDIYDIRDLLASGDGREITATIRRDKTEKTLKFKLRRTI